MKSVSIRAQRVAILLSTCTCPCSQKRITWQGLWEYRCAPKAEAHTKISFLFTFEIRHRWSQRGVCQSELRGKKNWLSRYRDIRINVYTGMLFAPGFTDCSTVVARKYAPVAHCRGKLINMIQLTESCSAITSNISFRRPSPMIP